MIHSFQIKQWAYQLGFDLVAIAPAEPVEYSDAFYEYLARGYQGDMRYLETNPDRRLDPRKLMPGARSVICIAMNYYTPSSGNHSCEDKTSGATSRPAAETTTGKRSGKVARFAWGKDYHDVVRARLRQLAKQIRSAAGSAEKKIQLRCFVDTAPLMEKAHAARAGLGWIGKNSLLINERFGSWLVLGEILTDLELEYDRPVADRCGSCRRCLEACPAGALVEPHILEGRKCISYLTIESKTSIPRKLKEQTAEWLYGCDVCQEICPFNENVVVTTIPEFQPAENRPDTRWIKQKNRHSRGLQL